MASCGIASLDDPSCDPMHKMHTIASYKLAEKRKKQKKKQEKQKTENKTKRQNKKSEKNRGPRRNFYPLALVAGWSSGLE